MTAHALPAVIAATEHHERPAPARLTTPTRDTIRRLFVHDIPEPTRIHTHPLTWPP